MTALAVSITTGTIESKDEDSLGGETVYILDPFYATGSIIASKKFEQSSTLVELDLEAMKLRGTQTPIESLRLLPSFFGSMNTENDSNGGSGSASPNLHGLGTLRTLTLINGRRAGGNSAFGLEPGGFANLNLVPQAAIKQIDILSETASTSYGSDAIGGVVNILTNERYNGTRLDGLYGNTTDGGGQTQQYSLTSGFPLDDRTHLTLLGSYYDRQVVWARDRKLSASANFIPLGGTNRGSATFSGRAVFLAGGNVVNGVLAPGIPFPTVPGDYSPYNQDTDAFNFNAYAPDIPAQRSASGMAALQHDLSETVTLYADALYTFSKQENGLAPAPWTAPGSAPPALYLAAQNSPHNPVAPTDLIAVSYRSLELGNIEIDFTRNAFRLTGGARGIIDDRWDWDTAVLYTQTEMRGDIKGIADARLLIPFIDSGTFNPFSQISVGINGGVPFNNMAALTFAEASVSNDYYENMFLYDAKASGKVWELPGGNLLSALGFEYRLETIDVTPDPIWASGQNLGGAGFSRSFSGVRHVFALFGESMIPLVGAKQEITAIHRAQIDAGLRYEHFSDRGDDPQTGLSVPNSYDNLSWKAIALVEPIEGLTIRGGYSGGFRAPTLFESYAAEVFDFPILIDPTGATPPGTPIPTLLKGNPSLDPEIAHNWTASADWQPEFLHGLRVGIAYYHTAIKDAIANGAQLTLDSNNPTDVIRTEPGGPVIYVNSRFINASALQTQGLDYNITYEWSQGDDLHLVASVGVNQILQYVVDVPGLGSQSFLGQYVDKRSNNLSPGAVPEWKGLATLDIMAYGWTLGTTFQYIAPYEDDSDFTFTGLPRTVEDYLKVNLVLSYEFEGEGSSWLNGTILTVGVDNVTNEPPPFAAGAFADGYDTSLYAINNRFIFGSVSKTF